MPDGMEDGHAELRRELELQSLAQLSHPNLITLFDGSLSGDGPDYLVLELVQGPDLATRLRGGPLSEAEARQICVQIADALDYVHAHGMVHRDVKPANILLGTEDGRPGIVRARLSDFGVARIVGAGRMTAADLTLGTAAYVAPEQARGANVDPPADVYALGLVMIEALTGKRCYDGPIHETLAARLVTPPLIPTTLPEPWPGLLHAMTALAPAERPTAAEVADRLRGDSLPLPAALAVMPPIVPPADDDDWYDDAEPRRRRGLMLAGVAAALGAIIAGGTYLLAGQAQPTNQTPGRSPTVHVSTALAKKHHHSAPAAAPSVAATPSANPTHHRQRPAATHSATQTSPAATPTPSTTASPSPTPSTSTTATATPTTSGPAASPASSTTAPAAP
jgi:serine/threonine protein kinase